MNSYKYNFFMTKVIFIEKFMQEVYNKG